MGGLSEHGDRSQGLVSAQGQAPEQEEGIFKSSSHESGLVPGSAFKGLLVCLEEEMRPVAGPV